MAIEMNTPYLHSWDSQSAQCRSSTSNADLSCILCTEQFDRDELDESLPKSVNPPSLTIEEASDQLYEPIAEYQARLLFLEPGPFGSRLKSQLDTEYMVPQRGIVFHWRKDRVQDTALSYTWGTQEFRHSILINDVEMPITSNLFALLQRRRYSAISFPLWIDALCINQSDLSEKATQVRNMMRIFERSSTVFVWLGDQSKRTNFGMRALQNPELFDLSRENVRAPLCISCLDALIEGIEDIGNRTWARRIWIKQEVYAAMELIVCCGARQLDWESYRYLKSIAARVLGRHGRKAALIPEQQACIRSLGTGLSWREYLRNFHLDDVSDATRLSDEQEVPGALYYLLLHSKGCQSTLDLDRIYALVAMAETVGKSRTSARHKQSYTFEINYNKTVPEAFTELALFWMNTLGLIWVLDRKPEMAFHSDFKLPSWVPDYRHPPPPPDPIRLQEWNYRCHDHDPEEIPLEIDQEIYFIEPSTLVNKGVHFATVAVEVSSENRPWRHRNEEGTLRRVLLEAKAFAHVQPFNPSLHDGMTYMWYQKKPQVRQGMEPIAMLPPSSKPGDWVVNVDAMLCIVIRKLDNEPEASDTFTFIGVAKLKSCSIIASLGSPKWEDRRLHRTFAVNWDHVAEEVFIVATMSVYIYHDLVEVTMLKSCIAFEVLQWLCMNRPPARTRLFSQPPQQPSPEHDRVGEMPHLFWTDIKLIFFSIRTKCI